MSAIYLMAFAGIASAWALFLAVRRMRARDDYVAPIESEDEGRLAEHDFTRYSAIINTLDRLLAGDSVHHLELDRAFEGADDLFELYNGMIEFQIVQKSLKRKHMNLNFYYHDLVAAKHLLAMELDVETTKRLYEDYLENAGESFESDDEPRAYIDMLVSKDAAAKTR